VQRLLIAFALAAIGCKGQDAALHDRAVAFTSLASTTAAIGEAWLAGTTSRTYTRTALERTSRLLDDERSALTAGAQLLADPRGARLSQAAEQLSRTIARLAIAVAEDDRAAAQRDVTALHRERRESP
jgi:hypothetical protein